MSDFALPSPAVDGSVVFVDLETTGGSLADHRITEIGIVEAGPSGVSRWSTLVNPQQSIPPFIQQLTGITDDMVREAPTFDAIAPVLFERLEGRLFAAHNAGFDRGFLRSEFKRVGFAFNPDVLCTVRLSRALFPHEKRHGLDALIERHALMPIARHRALADADLLWQFWQRLHGELPLDVLREHVQRAVHPYRIAGEITEDMLDSVPAGCGVYAFYDKSDVALYVGRSVRLRQRLRAHLAGERRSAREMRMVQQIWRVQWLETGGELGALLTEAQWIAALQPVHNRAPRSERKRSGNAPWPFRGAILFEERSGTDPSTFHVVDHWRYLGAANSVEQASELAAKNTLREFEPSTYRILQSHLARGLQVFPLVPANECAVAHPLSTLPTSPAGCPTQTNQLTLPTPPDEQTCASAVMSGPVSLAS
ncbi:MAG TPA: exonuclease domain-containing protein [Trinickia sp.]|jgi:DNA polymerase-3 subunit epsilon|uniref:exonuclease domain-containing protein n=1 Tax=Trinickia sp. TaxID=2571163 RepID=UPI002CD3B35A|nr:exonuclease domain-containing protein [Trinickia sp.]HTI19013.1 exonuclease domain-containing protein [Trinickia sp.]